MHPDVVRFEAAPTSRGADLVGWVASPPVLVPVLVYVLGCMEGGPVAAAGWTAITVVFCVAIPLGILAALVRHGGLSDAGMVRGDQRTIPMLLAGLSVLIGAALVVWWGAPRTVLALFAALLAGIVVTAVVSRRHKISIHTACATLAAVVTVASLGGWGWLALTVPVVVGWARRRAGRHSWAQVVTGAVGGLGMSLVFLLVR